MEQHLLLVVVYLQTRLSPPLHLVVLAQQTLVSAGLGQIPLLEVQVFLLVPLNLEASLEIQVMNYTSDLFVIKNGIIMS